MGVEGGEVGDEGGGGVSSSGCSWATAFVECSGIVATVGGAVGGQGDVGLCCAAGEDVEGGVDGDFEVAALCRVVLVGFG